MIEGLGLIHCSGIEMNERMEMQFAKIVTISQFYLLICSCLLILPIQAIVEDQHWFDPLSLCLSCKAGSMVRLLFFS
jgi:hypothetical protein